jgi:hypothetical protein
MDDEVRVLSDLSNGRQRLADPQAQKARLGGFSVYLVLMAVYLPPMFPQFRCLFHTSSLMTIIYE